MILDVFPSYKDKDMVDLLYQYERATGLSLNILVEKYLEKILYKQGYMNVPVNEEQIDTPNQIEEVLIVKKENFKVLTHGDYKEISYNNLNFGNHPPNIVGELINKLCDYTYEELTGLSKDNYPNYKKYPSFLRAKLNNPSLTLEQYQKETSLRLSLTKGKYQVKYKDFSFGTFNEDESKIVRNDLLKFSLEKLDELQEYLSNNKGNRRKLVLKWIKLENGNYGKE